VVPEGPWPRRTDKRGDTILNIDGRGPCTDWDNGGGVNLGACRTAHRVVVPCSAKIRPTLKMPRSSKNGGREDRRDARSRKSSGRQCAKALS